MPERNFPPPWSVEELDSCFVVKDANGQALAYMFSRRGLVAGFGANCSRAMRRNASLPFAKLLQLLHEPHT